MGLGFTLDRNGTNILFVGGTGMLAFLDNISRLVLHNCKIKEDHEQFGKKFKIILYYAVSTEQ